MQFSPTESEQTSHVRVGRDVRARGARWHIVDIRSYDACSVVTLSGLSPPVVGVERRILHPFDVIEPIEQSDAPQIVGAPRWRAACRAAIAAETPPGSLRRGRSARIDLMAHQLEPALAIVRGAGTRLLLADEVGLGKTIQAGLILSELRDRAWIDRVLVLTPAGLRDQWSRELSVRFDVEATVVDGRVLRRLTATLPLGMNPWSAPRVAVASTDYVKRAEVLPAVTACRWDAVVVDEAHGVAGDSDRRAAVEALASRASYVLLLTATPHSGDPGSFGSLCALGSSGAEPLLVFRRRRIDVRNESRRRVHAVRVRPSAAEHRMHAALARYSEAVRAERGPDACLALSVLHKRAFSCAWSLSQSVARRLATLAQTGDATDAEQMALPLGDPDGDLTMADEPPEWPRDLALTDTQRECRLLTAVLETSKLAALAERKIAALRRLLRRSHESAIVFTEYRDTLLHVQRALAGLPVAVLHGGMTREERTDALGAFERGTLPVLLATDAAGEGLNLQRACRLVVNLELPWNPMRLEQRIGRVDRIGQGRTVHAFHLVADRTGEMQILDRLKARVARAQADIGASDPVSGRDEEQRLARLVVAGERLEDRVDTSAQLRAPAPDGAIVVPDFRDAALAEVERLRLARAMDAMPGRDAHQTHVVRASRTGLRSVIGSRALLIWRVSWENRAGVTVESRLVAITVDGVPPQTTRAAMRQTVHELASGLRSRIESFGCDWRESAAHTIRTFAATRLRRERAILERVSRKPPAQFQPGLFDRRAERTVRLSALQAAESTQQVVDRIARVEREAEIVPRQPTLLLAVLP